MTNRLAKPLGGVYSERSRTAQDRRLRRSLRTLGLNERRLVACAEQEPGIGAANLAFVNRLSSLLFVAALREDGLAGRVVTSTRAGE